MIIQDCFGYTPPLTSYARDDAVSCRGLRVCLHHSKQPTGWTVRHISTGLPGFYRFLRHAHKQGENSLSHAQAVSDLLDLAGSVVLQRGEGVVVLHRTGTPCSYNS